MSVVAFDPLRDSRHKDTASAREQADWLETLKLEGLSPRTIEDYEWATARGMRMFPHKTLADFTDGDLAHVFTTFPQAGRRERVAAYRKWFKWALLTRRIERNPMDLLPAIRRRGKKIVPTFTDAEAETLMGLPLVDGALMDVLFLAGLRKGEARRLRPVHFKPEAAQLYVIGGKGDKDRIVPAGRLTSRLAELILLEGLGPDDHFWYAIKANAVSRRVRRSQPIGEGTFHRWWVRCLEAAGVRYLKPHCARHTFARRWLQRGGRLSTLSVVMGHESIRTTFDLYGHFDTADLAADLALVESFHSEGLADAT